MELRVSAQERGLSPSVYRSHPDDKEISDDDDDDRNHKHRRREDARSQSFEDEVFTKPYRRGNKTYQNGNLYGETGSQSNETWRKYSFNSLEKDLSTKFDQKRTGFTQSSRGPPDFNQKIRSNSNQPFSGDVGRGRGRDAGFWNPRFGSIDIASQMGPQGSVAPHSLFSGRGLQNVSNSRGPSWNAFGGMDMIHHQLGLQGSFGTNINASLNMGLSRQRCRDFEEQGFCLRGDMCPMEHGVNRIVVEDVQSLSQFNLPVSLASTNLSIAPVGPTTNVLTNTMSNNRSSSHGKNNNGMDVSGPDFYDPDQPLWGNDSHPSTGPGQPIIISQPNIGKNNSLLDPTLSDGSDDEELATTTVGPTNTSSFSTKKRTKIAGENMISKTTPPNFINSETTEGAIRSNSTQDLPGHQKGQFGQIALKTNGRMIRKVSQKAERTLFVNGIPQQSNKRESLLSHFKRFGEVINIYIPLNTERAFVQFSKREEAEAALLAPDAVMGNRFIKLFWANRDNIPEAEGHNLSFISAANKRKDDPQLQNDGIAPVSVDVSGSEQTKAVVVANDGAKVGVGPPPLQKKMENLEVLKEELRKKQEMLDQKRNEFRRKLIKLEKQATGVKSEVAPEQVAKKPKLGISVDSTKVDGDPVVQSPHADVAADNKNSSKSVDTSGLLEASRTNVSLTKQESLNLKSPVINRFKLDNRPTAFKIVPPLPDGLADVPALKEHFSPFGDLSKVQLDDVGPNEAGPKPASPQIHFTTRHAAEKAFLNAKSWKGHNLQFIWLNSKPNSVVGISKTSPEKKRLGSEEMEKGKKADESNRSN